MKRTSEILSRPSSGIQAWSSSCAPSWPEGAFFTKGGPPGCVPARTPTTSNEEQRRVNYASDGGGTPNAGQIFGELRNVERHVGHIHRAAGFR